MLKRTVSLALALVMILCLFASCDVVGTQMAEGVIDIADDELSRADYTVNTTIVYSSSSEALSAAISDVDEVSLTFEKKGHSSKSTLAMSIDGVAVESEYLITAGVLYYTYTEAKGDQTYAVKEKVNLNADERAAIYEDLGIDAPLSHTDFDSVNLQSNGNVSIVTCEGIKEDSAVKMAELVKSELGITGADVAVVSAALKMRFTDGKYSNEYITVNYVIKLGETVYDLEMQLTREYDLTKPVEISAPTDADAYVKTTYEGLTK